MDDHNFILWDEQGGSEPNYDEIIENDDIDELNDMIEEQVEGYEEVNMLEEASENDEAYYIDEDIISDPQEMYLPDDQIVNGSSHIGVGMSHLIEQRVQEAENKIIGDRDANEEYSATVEEVITEDWPLEGEDMVQVAMEQVVTSDNFQEDDTETVPLHTEQDEYTTSRPYPCDFCSRRFRKKANLMNHMVAHQNVRPHMCNLCGSRYVRKCDLINHLKIHAYNIEDEASMGGSSTGGKKKPKYDELDYFNDTYDEIPDDDDFDYNHYSKPTTSTAPPVRSAKAPAKKKIAKKTVPKFEKLSKDKALPKDLNITFGDRHQEKEEEHVNHYVERFPITDPRKPFVCQHCGVAFTREKALESHVKLHANQEPTFDCEICGDSFFDNTSLEEHMELRHDYSSRVRKTGGKSTSGKTLPRAKVLETMDYDDDSNSEYEPDKNNDDLDDEDEEEDVGNNCDKCHMSFKNPEALKRHIKTHFIKSEILSDDGERIGAVKGSSSLGCNVCGESFTEALDLLAHAEIHARFQPFKCQLCGDMFFEENKIKIHLNENHSTELTESSCRLCGKQCRDQRSLIKHSWEHSREKNHPCSKCGKTFHNKARLKRHISSHRNKSVMCEVCHEEFPDGRQLMNHRHSHTKSNQFPCNECGKTFGSRSSQQIHIRIHTGERPYGCRFCWKAFADGGTLRKHERIHTGEKPYCCLVCPRAFNQRVVLREHIRSHHSAPDPVNGTNATPYYCSLCGDLFSVSLDLIQHLIAHSDRSTAAKRVQPVGPRKYKRRRKLNGDSDNSDFVSPEPTVQRNSRAIKKEPFEIKDVKKNILYPAFPITNEICEFKLPDEIFRSIGKRVPELKVEDDKRSVRLAGTSTRPKMIYTQKTRVAAADGKRKTKTMIQKKVVQSKGKLQATRLTRQQLQEPPKDLFDNDESSETWSNDDPNEDVLDTLLKRERKLSEKFTIDLVNDLQDILRSPLKNNEDKNFSNGEDEDIDSSPTRRSRRQQISRSGLSQPNKVQKLAMGEGSNRVTVKQEDDEDEGMCCGICGDSFETRGQLLSHVPIHI